MTLLVMSGFGKSLAGITGGCLWPTADVMSHGSGGKTNCPVWTRQRHSHCSIADSQR
jgi:hypothetical protein